MTTTTEITTNAAAPATQTLRMADADCGMNTQAFMLLQYLSTQTVTVPEAAFLTTGPYSNCRERGFVVSVSKQIGSDQRRHWVFYEHRNSDELCCLRWDGPGHVSRGYRADDVEGFTDKWTITKSWPYMSIVDAANWLHDEIREFCGVTF